MVSAPSRGDGILFLTYSANSDELLPKNRQNEDYLFAVFLTAFAIPESVFSMSSSVCVKESAPNP